MRKKEGKIEVETNFILNMINVSQLLPYIFESRAMENAKASMRRDNMKRKQKN